MRHELITFGIASQRFGSDVMAVRAIRAGLPVTRRPPDAGWHETIAHFIAGIAPPGDDMVMVLDLDRLPTELPRELSA